ncbi:MAG TPA: hypothetical protein VFJ43_03425 [Bacteroidia bacterium]|nr:hypothetical protein [Bacteroidia bacterium]
MYQPFPGYDFHYFSQYEFHGLIIRDPITSIGNLFLCLIGLWCFRKIAKFKSSQSEEIRAGVRGWQLFFLISAIAYSFGIPVHGFSYYIPAEIHLPIWITMGWIQISGIYFVQVGTAKRYFPEKLKWIRPLAIFQAVFFCALMVYIRKFGAVNIDIAVGLIPIALWNLYLYSKKKNSSSLIGWGILFAGIPGLVVAFKIMFAPWFSYNDFAHLALVVSLLMICRGLVKCLESGTY